MVRMVPAEMVTVALADGDAASELLVLAALEVVMPLVGGAASDVSSSVVGRVCRAARGGYQPILM